MDELFRILPDEYVGVIKYRILAEKLSEVRIVNRAPVRVCYDGSYRFLCENGLTSDKHGAFVAGERAAEEHIRPCRFGRRGEKHAHRFAAGRG